MMFRSNSLNAFWFTSVLVLLFAFLVQGQGPRPTQAKFIPGQVLKFDFGAEGSPVREGFTRVTGASEFDFALGFGWVNPKDITSLPVPESGEEASGMNSEERARMQEERLREEMEREEKLREERERAEKERQEREKAARERAKRKGSKGMKKEIKPIPEKKKKKKKKPEEPKLEPTYPNKITDDGLSSTERNMFGVRLKKGNYYVYIWSGLKEGTPKDYHDFEVSFGPRTTKIKIPGPYQFEKRILRVKPDSRGVLKIKFMPKTNWVISGMVIFPVSQERKVKAEFLDALEKEMAFLPPEVASKWNEVKHVDDHPMPKFSSIDKKREFAIFSKHYTEPVYSNTVPREHQLNPQLNFFATPGEYEPITFTIHPLSDLRAARVSCSDLKSSSGKIPESDISIRFVRYMLARPNYSELYSYHEVPDVLEEHRTLEMHAGKNQRVWMTVKVPEDTRPGFYQGKVTIQGNAGKTASLKITLRVLPFKLESNPKQVFGIYYRDPLKHVSEENSEEVNQYLENKARWEREDMVAHGLSTYIGEIQGLTRSEAGVWTIDSVPNERFLDLDKEQGMLNHPRVISLPIDKFYETLVDEKGQGSHLSTVKDEIPETFYEEITKMVEVIEAERKRQDWPEFIYYPVDEPGTSEAAINYMVGVLKAIRQVEGVKTYVTADPTHDAFKPLWPYVNIWSCQPFVYSKEKLEAIRKEKNVDIWCYPNHVTGENDHTPIRGARMTFGFGMWKSGVNVFVPWIYQHSTGDPWNYLDGPTMDFYNRSTPEGRPIPVVLWEAYREGIDDSRYIYTLESMIEKAIAKGGRAKVVAEKSAAQLKSIYDVIKTQPKYQYDNLWPGPDFDAYRWLIASEILRLQRTVDQN